MTSTMFWTARRDPATMIKPPSGRKRGKDIVMLTIQGATVSRRELLQVGAVGLLGLNLPDVLRHHACARSAAVQGAGFGRAQSLIFLYLQGSPSHIDLWDPKPAAPVEYRGEFQ